LIDSISIGFVLRSTAQFSALVGGRAYMYKKNVCALAFRDKRTKNKSPPNKDLLSLHSVAHSLTQTLYELFTLHFQLTLQSIDELIQRQENVINLHHFIVFDVSHTIHSIDLSRFVVE
jgi:hypothetical protein